MLKSYLIKIFQFFILFKKHFIVFGSLLILLSFFKLFNYSFNDIILDANYAEYFDANKKILGIRIPKKLYFAGEKVPVSNNVVYDAVERELVLNSYGRYKSLVLHKRAHIWFSVIDPILKKYNIPEDFKYIALIESQLTNAVSNRGATGFWQIIASTGLGYGMEINNEVDERYNVIKSTEVACKYFKEAYKIFNNWTLVAASYNIGIGGLQLQLKKQKVDNYYALALNEETSRYIYRILAMKEIISKPNAYGFILSKKDYSQSMQTKIITINSPVENLSDFALSQNIDFEILKRFNPWLLSNSLTIMENKKYIIELPKNDLSNYYFEDKNDENTVLNKIDSAVIISVDSLLK